MSHQICGIFRNKRFAHASRPLLLWVCSHWLSLFLVPGSSNTLFVTRMVAFDGRYTTTIFLICLPIFLCWHFCCNIHGGRKEHIEYIPFSRSSIFIYLLCPNNVSHFLLFVNYFRSEQDKHHVFFILMSFISIYSCLNNVSPLRLYSLIYYEQIKFMPMKLFYYVQAMCLTSFDLSLV